MLEELKLLYKYLLKMNGKIDEVQVNDLGEYDIYGTYEQEFSSIRRNTMRQTIVFYLTLTPNV